MNSDNNDSVNSRSKKKGQQIKNNKQSKNDKNGKDLLAQPKKKLSSQHSILDSYTKPMPNIPKP